MVSQGQEARLRSSELLCEVVHVLEPQNTLHAVTALRAEASETIESYKPCSLEDETKHYSVQFVPIHQPATYFNISCTHTNSSSTTIPILRQTITLTACPSL
jgi:hypothetical protein